MLAYCEVDSVYPEPGIRKCLALVAIIYRCDILAQKQRHSISIHLRVWLPKGRFAGVGTWNPSCIWQRPIIIRWRSTGHGNARPVSPWRSHNDMVESPNINMDPLGAEGSNDSGRQRPRIAHMSFDSHSAFLLMPFVALRLHRSERNQSKPCPCFCHLAMPRDTASCHPGFRKLVAQPAKIWSLMSHRPTHYLGCKWLFFDLGVGWNSMIFLNISSKHMLVGGFNLKNIKVSWDDDIPNIWKVINGVKPPATHVFAPWFAGQIHPS